MADLANTYGEAVRRLARRPLTVRELRDRLLRSGHAAGEVETVLDRLLDEGSLNDRVLASALHVGADGAAGPWSGASRAGPGRPGG